jgi:ribosomal protein L28
MMMTKRERKRESLVAHKNVDKMEAFGCLTFSPKKQLSLKQRVGYSVVAFLFPPRTIRRTRRDATRAFRRPFLVGLRNTTRIISFAQQRVRVEVSTRTLRPLSRIEHHVSSLVQDEEDTGRRKNEQQMGEFEHGQTVVGVFFAHRRRFDREIDVRTREVRARAPPDFHW